MKSKSTLSILLCIPNLLYAYEPSGQGYDSNLPDIGLPDGDEVWIGLIVGIVAIFFGYLILNNKSDESGAMGCLGVILMGIGIISLLPLLAWICSILSVVFAVGVVILIIILIISFLSAKK